MSEMMKPRLSGGRMAGAVLLGALIGVLSPYMLVAASLVFLAPVLTARLYAHGGPWPAAASCAMQVFLAFLLFGPVPAAMVLVALVAPLAVTLRLVGAGSRPFAEVARLSVPVWMLCTALAVAVGHLAVGMSLADYVAGILQRQLEALPAGIVDQFLTVLYGGDLSAGLNLSTLSLGFMDAAERARGIHSLVSAVREEMALVLPGALLSAAAVTALSSAAWPSRCLVRARALKARCWAPFRTWHLPGSMTLCLLAMYAAALIFAAVSPAANAQSVAVAIQTLAMTAFQVQAAGSLERRLSARGMRPAGRAALAALLVVVPPFSGIAFYYGMLSALFGPTYGVVARYLRRRRGDDGED